ncbi:immunoglobulin superfamily member 3-like [Trichomycterus rosablanca]|uniref:immunoglobulin superfamily member 3-like n=1 Tax=Trichomycterus rosablanca TaxID=2290929 RepID=UPI002F360924
MIKLILMCIVSLETGFVTSVFVIQSEKLQMFVPGSDLKHQHYIKEVVYQDQTQDSQLKESLHPGDNVTLQCTVVAERCAEEHSVFWIRHGSGESHPGIIYTDGDSSGQCENRSDAASSTQSCIYSLPKRNLSTSDVGTYYCALATCGKILFGNGTTLELTGTGFVTSVSVIQPKKLQTFVPGQTVTLFCKISEFNGNYLYWFRQSLGEGPTCIVTLFGATSEFYGDFKHDKRFTAKKNGNLFTLTINNTKPNDTAIYYCSIWDYDLNIFGNGVFLSYEGSGINHQHYIKEVVSLDQTQDSLKLKESLHPGDNVTLQCTVVTQSCAGEHSVFWIRHGSGESHPGIIYTDGDSSDQCKNKSDAGSSTQSCIYSLPKRNLRTSDAGTYYCAVATCGGILFGNGTTLEFTGSKDEYSQIYWGILGLALLNLMCFIIIAVLLWSLAKNRNMCPSGSETRMSVPTFEPKRPHASASFIDESVEREDMSYAALRFQAKKSKKQETQRDSHQTIIYSSVRD